MEDEEQIPADALMFLAFNTNAVEGFVSEILRDMESGIHEDWLHTKLLDHMYKAEEDGVGVAAFQNLAAGSLLLLAVERKKK